MKSVIFSGQFGSIKKGDKYAGPSNPTSRKAAAKASAVKECLNDPVL